MTEHETKPRLRRSFFKPCAVAYSKSGGIFGYGFRVEVGTPKLRYSEGTHSLTVSTEPRPNGTVVFLREVKRWKEPAEIALSEIEADRIRTNIALALKFLRIKVVGNYDMP